MIKDQTSVNYANQINRSSRPSSSQSIYASFTIKYNEANDLIIKDQKTVSYVNQLLFFLRHPIKTLENIKYDTSVNAFFSVFVFTGIIRTLIAAFMPFKLFSEVLLQTTKGTDFVNTNVIASYGMDANLNSPFFRIPYYLLDFYLGEGLIILCSVLFFWLFNYAFTKPLKYPAEFGDMANIFLIACFPKFIYHIVSSLWQLMTNMSTLIPYNTLSYTLWSLFNPFALLQIALIGIGIAKLYDIKRTWIVSILVIYVFLSFVLS